MRKLLHKQSIKIFCFIFLGESKQNKTNDPNKNPKIALNSKQDSSKELWQVKNYDFYNICNKPMWVCQSCKYHSLPGAGILHIEFILHIECSTFRSIIFQIWNSSTGILSLPGANVRSSTHDKGHEEGGLAYAKAGWSFRSPPGNSRTFPPKTRVCLLSALCFHLHLWLYGGLSPTTSLKKELAYSSS